MRHRLVLGKREKRAIKWVLEGHTMQEAAARAGVHRVTLWRWFKLPGAEEYWEKLMDEYRL